MRHMFLFPLLFFILYLEVATGQLLHDACVQSVKCNPHITYLFFVDSLQSDNRSSESDKDYHRVAFIAVELAITNATNTILIIKDLQKSASDPFIKQGLSSCLIQYSDVIPTLKEADTAVKSKSYKDANIKATQAMGASTSCEDGFKGSVSPLTKQNSDFYELGAMAACLSKLLSEM
ncbi:putative invertase inhibitor [Tasmannia lanceolata]|uniref:putative invertase inhibitor n=1 Tax=Tasmannia lanceolata TaxID=3420 RepID=UPI00406347E2